MFTFLELPEAKDLTNIWKTKESQTKIPSDWNHSKDQIRVTQKATSPCVLTPNFSQLFGHKPGHFEDQTSFVPKAKSP